MSKGIVETVAGGLMIAAGVLIEIGTLGGGTLLAMQLITAGAGLVLSGVGTMLAKGPLQGFETATRNPIAPWNVIYGRKRVGGTVVYINSFGDNDKFLDMVMVLAAHPCEAVDELLFDQQRIQIGAHNTSFTPVQQTINIADIQRVGSVVTVQLNSDIPLLSDGDQVIIKDVTGDLTLNGKFPVTVISRGTPALKFSYVCGGPASHVIGAGYCLTAWADYGKKVYMEVLLGTQTLGSTFPGMISGTPVDADMGNIVNPNPNPWTADCSLVGKTAVWLRLHYNDAIFSNGLPQISFHVRGKNDIYDPRTTGHSYSENAALCIADHLANTEWGFKAAYGTEIPDADLIAAANICDEAVSLATGGTEPRYTCNGGFVLTMKKGEVLQNLLTSCAGRITYVGGQFKIWPGSWAGVSATISGTSIYSLATGPIRWRPNLSVANLYNGVKGTYISPVNNWQSSDFPRYAQDAEHGYNDGTPGNDYDANLDADGGDRRWFDIQLPFTISCPTAQRIAKIELLRRRQQGTGTFLLNMAGYQFIPMDVVAMDLPYFGWGGKTLEVQASRLKFEKQQDSGAAVLLLGTEIDVQETDSSIYSWSIGEELSPAGYQQAIVPDTRTPAPPTNVVVESDNNAIYVAWTAPNDAYVLNGGHIEVEYQLVAIPAVLWNSLAKMDPTVTEATIQVNLTPGESYTVQVRSVNAAGVPSAWVVAAPIATPLVPGPIQVSSQGWAPNQVQAPSADALFPNEFNFDVNETYTTLADGSPSITVAVKGKLPIDGRKVRIKGRRHIHSGIIGAKVSSVSTNTIISTDLVDTSGSPIDLTGRVVSVLGHPTGSVPYTSYLVTAWNHSTGAFTVTPDPAGTVQAGDAISVRYLGYDNTATPLAFTDSGIQNQTNGYSGMTPGAEVGRVFRVIRGKSRGESREITANTATQISWHDPLLLDNTSVGIVEENVELFTFDSTDGQVGDPTASATLNLPILNFQNQPVVLTAFTVDQNGNESSDVTAPLREVWIYGAQGTRTITASTTMLPMDRVVLCDASTVTQPSPTTLAADVTSTSQTNFDLVDGSATVNGTDFLVGSERCRIQSGGGTNSLIVGRGAAGTTPATHSTGDGVTLPGALTFTCLPSDQIPNQELILKKIDTSINYVAELAGGSDTFDNGATTILLPDNTDQAGLSDVIFPGS